MIDEKNKVLIFVVQRNDKTCLYYRYGEKHPITVTERHTLFLERGCILAIPKDITNLVLLIHGT